MTGARSQPKRNYFCRKHWIYMSALNRKFMQPMLFAVNSYNQRRVISPGNGDLFDESASGGRMPSLCFGIDSAVLFVVPSVAKWVPLRGGRPVGALLRSGVGKCTSRA